MSNTYGGAFGSYPEGSIGAVLNCLLNQYQIPMHIVDSVQVGNGEVFYAGKLYGTYEWIEGEFLFKRA